MKKAVIDSKNNVWGIGGTEKMAFRDARHWVSETYGRGYKENMRFVDITELAVREVHEKSGDWNDLKDTLKVENEVVSTIEDVTLSWKETPLVIQDKICSWLLNNEEKFCMSIWDLAEDWAYRKDLSFGKAMDVYAEYTLNPIDVCIRGDDVLWFTMNGEKIEMGGLK